jgi:hypothetical protein
MSRKKAPLANPMLADLAAIVCNPQSDSAMRTKAINIAYEIGKSDGRLECANNLAATLTPATVVTGAS